MPVRTPGARRSAPAGPASARRRTHRRREPRLSRRREYRRTSAGRARTGHTRAHGPATASGSIPSKKRARRGADRAERPFSVPHNVFADSAEGRTILAAPRGVRRRVQAGRKMNWMPLAAATEPDGKLRTGPAPTSFSGRSPTRIDVFELARTRPAPARHQGGAHHGAEVEHRPTGGRERGGAWRFFVAWTHSERRRSCRLRGSGRPRSDAIQRPYAGDLRREARPALIARSQAAFAQQAQGDPMVGVFWVRSAPPGARSTAR